MFKQNLNKRKQARLITAVSGTLLIIPIMLVDNMALAVPRMQAEKRLSQASPSPGNPGTSDTPSKPRPSIFNEAPYNLQPSTPPADSNTALPTKPETQSPSEDVVQPPLPETQQPPSAMVTPVDGKINIRLINTTNAAVNYQLIGNTNQRTLKGNSDVTLQNITTPVTLTFGREDKGLLRVNAKAASSGLLEVSLDETINLDEDKSTLVVQPTGAVFVN